MKLSKLRIFLTLSIGIACEELWRASRKYMPQISTKLEHEVDQQFLLPNQVASNTATTVMDGAIVKNKEMNLTISQTAHALEEDSSTVATTLTFKMADSNETSHKTPHPYDEIIQETTRILYGNSPHLDHWLATPPPTIYIYNTIAPDISNMEYVSTCVNYRLMGIGAKLMKKRGFCPWDPLDYCEDNLKPESGSKSRFRHYRSNYNNDIALIRFFLDYPHQTTDPDEADFFVVPYPHKSHCLCTLPKGSKNAMCGHAIDEIHENVTGKLAYYETHKARHLFFLGVDFTMANRGFRHEVSMSLSLGSSDDCVGKVNESCGHFVTPYLSTTPAYAVSRSLEWFTDRPRQYSVAAAFGTPPPLQLRRDFVSNQTLYLGNNVGGMPHKVIDFGKLRLFLSESDIVQLYTSSIFCPILPGDNCPQKRFFEVMLNGCIPVVPNFSRSNEADFPTFYKHSGYCSIRTAYPFIRGTFLNDLEAGIDYMKDLVVPFDGKCGLACMKPALEAVMGNVTELRRLRTNLHTFTRFFRYGLGKDAYQSVDAFSAIVVGLRHYAKTLSN